MPPLDRNLSIIRHIQDYCGQIGETVERFGSDWETFRQDRVYQNASALCILQIGELVGKLTDDFKVAWPGMPWQQIKAMRNIVAHDYGSVSASVVWEIITEDIPNLERYCNTVLSAEYIKTEENLKRI